MKKHNTVKVILVAILICFLFTWIFEAAYFQGQIVEQGRVQMGLFDLFSYLLTSLSYFGYIALYIVVVGGFYGVLYKIPAYSKLLNGMANAMKKHSLVYISLIVVLLGVITSICGLQLGLVLFFPFLAALIMLMGYDKIVVALTLVGSTMLGIAGSTFAYNNVNMAESLLGDKITNNIPIKFAILLVALAILIVNIVLYSKRFKNVSSSKEEVKEEVKEAKVEVKKVEEEKPVAKKVATKSSSKAKTTTKKASTAKATTKKSTSKKTTSKSKNNNKAAVIDDEVIVIKETAKEENSRKTWPIIVGFCILLVVLILAFIPWSNAFGLDAMSKADEAVNGFKLFGFPLFAKILGTHNAFGDWLVTDMLFPIALVTLLLALIYGVKFSDVLDGFAKGAKKALGPAFVTLLIYVILVINTYHPYQFYFYQFILGKGDSLNVVRTSLTAIVSSLLNVDPAYAFQASMPYLASLVTKQEVYPIVTIIYQAMYGFTMLIAPTSIVLMGVLNYLGVSYKEWFKAVWKLLVEILIVFLIVFLIITLI